MLALSEGDRIYRVKRMSEHISIEDNILFMRWKPWSDVEVRTWLIAGAPWHVRIHCIVSKRVLDIADGGFALGIEDRNGKRSLEEQRENENGALAKSSWGDSGIRLLYGDGKTELIHPNANTNLLHARTVIPTATASLGSGTRWFVTGVYGNPAGGGVSDDWADAPYVERRDQRLLIHRDSNELFEVPMREGEYP
jgi:hypothetical protein